MANIERNILDLKAQIPENVKLVAVSKTKPNEDILEAYNAGHKIFGENKIQDLVKKYETLPKDIEWHMIGHVQTNKVKYIAPFVSLIHAVDSFKLLNVINKEAVKNNRIIDCLIQIFIAEEDTKFGSTLEQVKEILIQKENEKLLNVNIIGLMGMSTFTSDFEQVRNEFKQLKKAFNQLKEEFFKTQSSFKEISMGMSGDYQIAIEEGSTMIRVGSSIFGSRY